MVYRWKMHISMRHTQESMVFKSFALWLVHGPMQEMIRLASMEMQTENSNDIAIFFQLFNEILEKVSGIPNYKFNP